LVGRVVAAAKREQVEEALRRRNERQAAGVVSGPLCPFGRPF
jgi:hypothetical protein